MSAQPRVRIALCSVALATALGAAGCSSSSKSAAPTTAANAAPASGSNTITIKNFSFGDKITVKAGATVTVKNTDSTAHTVASDSTAFDTGVIAPGTSKTFTAPKAGTYPFHCNIHDYMKGTLTVTG